MVRTPKEHKAADHEYYLRNRERERAKSIKYYHEHTDQRRAYQHRYCSEHPEKTKAYRSKNRERLNARSRQWNRENAARAKANAQKYRSEHPEKMKALRLSFLKGRIDWLNDLKRTMKCSMCGQSFPDLPLILDFHHRGEEPKEDGIARLLTTRKASKDVVLAEIAKCIPLCANCHRRTHFVENESRKNAVRAIASGQKLYKLSFRKKRADWLNDLKRTMKCSMCGQSFPDCPPIIDFHHSGRELKNGGVGLLTSTGYNQKRVLAEIAKCTPLCANCHRRVHLLERQKKKGV